MPGLLTVGGLIAPDFLRHLSRHNSPGDENRSIEYAKSVCSSTRSQHSNEGKRWSVKGASNKASLRTLPHLRKGRLCVSGHVHAAARAKGSFERCNSVRRLGGGRNSAVRHGSPRMM